MKTLKLVTTENFNGIDCDFYRSVNNNIFLTREQIGKALEYKNPQKAIEKIHLRHKDRLDKLCIRIKSNPSPQNGGSGVPVETIYYTERGIMEICRWSKQKKANEFMDWCWDIIENYRNNMFNSYDFRQDFINLEENYKLLFDTVETIKNSLDEIQNQTSNTDKTLLRVLKDNEKEIFKTNGLPEWIRQMMPYFIVIRSYYFPNDKGFKNTYAKIFDKFNKIHGSYVLSLASMDFCYQNNCKRCNTMDMIAYTPEIREKTEVIIYDIFKEIAEIKRKEINKSKQKENIDNINTNNN